MLAVLRILFEVAWSRLRRLEMANLAASVSVMLALRLPWPEAALRTLAGALLNLLVYANNDFYHTREDLGSSHKDQEKTLFLRDHPRQAVVAQLLLAAVIVVVTASRPVLLVSCLGAAAAGWVYSAKLKTVPFADLLSILVTAFLGTSIATPPDRPLGWLLAAQLGIFATCFQLIQLLRDLDEDAQAGTRTTAVALGAARTVVFERILIVASTMFAALFLHRWLALLLLVAAVMPVGSGSQAAAHWNRVRAVFGLVWLGLVAWVWWKGAAWGLLN